MMHSTRVNRLLTNRQTNGWKKHNITLIIRQIAMQLILSRVY